jgi:hypothetical protein
MMEDGMAGVRDRLTRYGDDPSMQICEVSPEELAEADAEAFPVGRPVRVETLHPDPGGVLVTRELSRRQDGRMVLLVDVYSRERYWRARVPMRAHFRRVFHAVRARAEEENDVVLLHSRADRRNRRAHLAYMIRSAGEGTVAEQYRAMSALDERLRARSGAAG